MKDQFTPWFSPETKPIREGVYQTLFCWPFIPVPLAVGYSFWNGRRWAVTKDTVDKALVASFNGAVTDKAWRGLSRG